MDTTQWQSPASARPDGRLYYLLFDKSEPKDLDRTYFRAREGGWYCLSPMIKVTNEPIAVLPL
jgi:hypothetical protein